MKTLFALILLAALTAQAQFQTVDVTTRTTNTTFSAAQISITNEGAGTLAYTNAHYWAFNSNNVQIGDSLPAAFGKINWNFYYASNTFIYDTNLTFAGLSGNLPYPFGVTWTPTLAQSSNQTSMFYSTNSAGGITFSTSSTNAFKASPFGTIDNTPLAASPVWAGIKTNDVSVYHSPVQIATLIAIEYYMAGAAGFVTFQSSQDGANWYDIYFTTNYPGGAAATGTISVATNQASLNYFRVTVNSTNLPGTQVAVKLIAPIVDTITSQGEINLVAPYGVLVNGAPIGSGTGGSASNAIANLDGFGTNTTLTATNTISGISMYPSTITNLIGNPMTNQLVVVGNTALYPALVPVIGVYTWCPNFEGAGAYTNVWTNYIVGTIGSGYYPTTLNLNDPPYGETFTNSNVIGFYPYLTGSFLTENPGNTNMFGTNLLVAYAQTNYVIPIGVLQQPGGEIQINAGGLTINTNNDNGYALEVNGGVDAVGGFSVAGVPQPQVTANYIFTNGGVGLIATGTNLLSGAAIINTNFGVQGYVVTINSTNIPGVSAWGFPYLPSAPAPAVFAGLYLPATNNDAYYTNQNGMQYLPSNSGLASFFNGFPTVAAEICSNFNDIYFPQYFLTYPNNVQSVVVTWSFAAQYWGNPGTLCVTVSNGVPSPAGTRIVVATNYAATANQDAVYVAGGVTASYYDVLSNSWSLNLATNGMLNFSTRLHVSSNGVPVNIYESNGVPMIYYETVPGGGTLP